MRKLFITFAITLVALMAMSVMANWSKIRDFPKLFAPYYSKQFCSCYFVVQQNADSCHRITQEPIYELEPSVFELNEDSKKIFVKMFGYEAEARYMNERHGCSVKSI